MVTHSPAHLPSTQPLRRTDWLRIGTGAAVLSAAAVVLSQLLVFAIWPELAAFEPLSSPPRSALFTAIPAFGATAVFAWLDRRAAQPARAFVLVSAAVLLVSIVPDYVLPFANMTFLASTVTAALHVLAAVVTVAVLLLGYRNARLSA